MDPFDWEKNWVKGSEMSTATISPAGAIDGANSEKKRVCNVHCILLCTSMHSIMYSKILSVAYDLLYEICCPKSISTYLL